MLFYLGCTSDRLSGCAFIVFNSILIVLVNSEFLHVRNVPLSTLLSFTYTKVRTLVQVSTEVSRVQTHGGWEKTREPCSGSTI